MIHTSRQLKDLVRNLAKETGIEAHVLIRKFVMERFLERTSLSKVIPHNAARADGERKWVLLKAFFCRNTSCIARKNDKSISERPNL